MSKCESIIEAAQVEAKNRINAKVTKARSAEELKQMLDELNTLIASVEDIGEKRIKEIRGEVSMATKDLEEQKKQLVSTNSEFAAKARELMDATQALTTTSRKSILGGFGKVLGVGRDTLKVVVSDIKAGMAE